MNDFTKEELLVLSHDLGILNNESKVAYEHASNEFIINLKNKLQSMIDNYCEHEQDFDAITISPTKRCIKCKEFYQ